MDMVSSCGPEPDPGPSQVRARRNEVEYRSSEAPAVTTEEVTADLSKVQALIDLAEKAIPDMPRFCPAGTGIQQERWAPTGRPF
ncbi:hypothetical protein ACH492_15660 [Streptomyces sp. NPDC019443]|uniref:hypothetical protein n=1 Tax=Streptomyces sp. NPDC019443 TaxID=3365061 RepID=UPI00378BFA74